eukprot:gene2315-2623_t
MALIARRNNVFLAELDQLMQHNQQQLHRQQDMQAHMQQNTYQQADGGVPREAAAAVNHQGQQLQDSPHPDAGAHLVLKGARQLSGTTGYVSVPQYNAVQQAAHVELQGPTLANRQPWMTKRGWHRLEQNQVQSAASTVPAAPQRPLSRPPATGHNRSGKKPWQPRMAPNEPNWNQEDYSARVQQACELVMHQRRHTTAGPAGLLPELETAKFAVLFMLHGSGWPNHALWECWQSQHPPGEVAMLVHMKAGVVVGSAMPGADVIQRRKLRTSIKAEWGDISLVQAQLDSLAEVLHRCPAVTHIALASGHDIPVQLLEPGLLLPGVSMFGSYQFDDKAARNLKVAAVDELVSEADMSEEEAQGWGRALVFHHQWMLLAREHAAALVSMSRDIMAVGRVIHRACESVRAGMAPDEFILITALRANGFVRSIQRVEVKPGMSYPPGCLLNSYPTLVLFPEESSPHPVLWTNFEESISCQVEKHTGEPYFMQLSLEKCLGICQERCAVFFRKVDVGAMSSEQLGRLVKGLESLWQRRRSGALTTSANRGGSHRRQKKRDRQQSGGKQNGLGRPSDEADSSPATTPHPEVAHQEVANAVISRQSKQGQFE